MGSWGSGRTGGRPIAEHSWRVDLSWMLRTGRAREGSFISGTLRWTCGGEPSGWISYQADMIDPDNARLLLTYTRGSGADAEKVRQDIQLTYTKPNYGGRRWWMICPYGGGRCAKLFLPGNGDRFASRKAWRMGYKSQRIVPGDQPFEALFRLQRKLGGDEGWEAGLAARPKGMWHRTYERLWRDYERLEHLCNIEAGAMLAKMGRGF